MQPAAQPPCRRHWLYGSKGSPKPRAPRRPPESLRVEPWSWIDDEPSSLRSALDRAALSEVRVYRLASDQWHLIGRARKVDLSTAQFESMSWRALQVMHSCQPQTSKTIN